MNSLVLVLGLSNAPRCFGLCRTPPRSRRIWPPSSPRSRDDAWVSVQEEKTPIQEEQTPIQEEQTPIQEEKTPIQEEKTLIREEQKPI